ncbi:MAG: hypothetical protein LBR16_04295 [Treponema sp.]|nr:hypothetical protein [Treponema sp.]
MVRNGSPETLVPWTEAPRERADAGHHLRVIAYGRHLQIIINGDFAAEAAEESIPAGGFAFAAACYESPTGAQAEGGPCFRALLDSLSIDTRAEEVEAAYEHWTSWPPTLRAGR